uniref:Purine nucleoside phosphorylase n=1 Tax=Hemiscolopendra marginata TaxID=943146 RepID=A0A646QC77_9MYRI
MSEFGYSYEEIKKIADFLLDKTKHRPRIGIICGSGLGNLADLLEEKDAFPYKDIPSFPVSTVPGHAGRLVFGLLEGIPTVCMQGRFHSYEGYELWKCAMPIRVMRLVGVKTVIITNAAGGINPEYQVGDVMIIKDHINFQGFAGNNPLRGPNDERWGIRFPPMNHAYNVKYRQAVLKIGEELGLKPRMHEGIYVMLGGPSFETVAELRALRLLGADAVGMSVTHEVITARHCGLEVLGISLITNKGIMEYETDQLANHEEVLETAAVRKQDLQNLVSKIVIEINHFQGS